VRAGHPSSRSSAGPGRFLLTRTSSSIQTVLGLIAFPAFAIAQENTLSPEATRDAASSAQTLIPWLLEQDDDLRSIPFSEIIFSATGKKLLAIDPQNEIDQRVLRQLSGALDEVLKQMNAPNSAIQNAARINEASSHFEEALRNTLNGVPGLKCDFAKTAADKMQRSGYPDLRLVDTATERIYYLDPKLYAAGSRASSFRTFYFEPKVATSKVRDDAVHLILGFEHEERKAGHWNFTRWDVVDLASFKVRLKAEFQGSNRDLYRPEAIVATSAK